MARKAPIPSKCFGQIEHVALLSKLHLCGRGRWPVVSVIRAASGVPNVPAGFPILFDADMAIIEPAFVWLMEHAELSGRAHATETVRTYGEHLHDWFDSLEQSGIERSEEHTSELQSLMRISYAVFCLKKKTINKTRNKRET